MRSCKDRRVKILARVVVTGMFSVCVASAIMAQGTPAGPPPGAGPPANINPRGEDRVRRTSEVRLRSAEMDASEESENQKRIQVAITNMKQDFTRLQIVRNDIARNLVAHKPMDYRLITEQTAEINRRAHRLSVYMLAQAAGDAEQESPSAFKSEEMIDALVKLCKLIDSFTENPALKNAAAVDAKLVEKVKEDKARADGDLLAIIKLSENIHKKSDSLKDPK